MGMRVFYSERIEDLALHLKLRLLSERSVADAFSFSQVVVPNANIAKWLRIRAFADAPSLCAGIEFPFIEQALYRAMNDSLDVSERVELLPMNAYANGIMSILLGERIPALDPFYRYIMAQPPQTAVKLAHRKDSIDYRKAWQLCVKLADLMDEYEVRRPDIVNNWLCGRGMKGGDYADATEAAEAEIARRLFGLGGIYPPDGRQLSLRQIYERVTTRQSPVTSHQSPVTTRQSPGTRHQAPYRFFGLSTLTPLQVAIFRWLAKDADVEVYHNNVCLEYWGDIETSDEVKSLQEKCRSVKDDTDFEIENPLLREWGVAGRETMRLLALLEEEGDKGVAFEWCDISQARSSPTSVLESVQRAIRGRKGCAQTREQDSSLQVVAAPGIRREVEMVHNAIIGMMMHDAAANLSDVAVLVTDMKRYKPMIEAVFDGRGVIPYGLVDTSVSGESECLDAFTALMELTRHGLTRETLFAVLANSCVQRALGFDMDDARAWRRLAEEIGAFDGFEEESDYKNFSWGAGLSRMRLGFITDDSPDCPVCRCADENALKFSEVVERLYRELTAFAGKRMTCAAWAQVLRGAISRFIDTGDDSREDAVRRAICETLDAMRSLPGEHPLDLPVAAVAELVGGRKASRSGYLTHGVTVASLQPMRPVPFKTIFVLGMGEGDFPGRESATTLDMRGAKRGLGDASLPMQNRYLFLETLMAARERLVISYPSLDTQKDAKLFPSGLVGELEKFVADAILPKEKEFREIPVPLLERGEEGDCPLVNPVGAINWDGYWAGVIPTYSGDVRRLAARIAAGEKRTEIRGGRRPDDVGEVGTAELASFVIDPLQGALAGRFAIPMEYSDGDDSSCPLELAASGRAKRKFDAEALEQVEVGEDGESGAQKLERIYDDFAAHGIVPMRETFFGMYSFSRILDSYIGDEDDGFLLEAKKFIGALPDGDENFTRTVILKNSEEYSKSADNKPHWPPSAVVAPLLDWLKIVSQKSDSSPRKLEIVIVDFAREILARWQWDGIDPECAKAALDALARRYAMFIDEPLPDGRYLKADYKIAAKALDSLALEKFPEPDDEATWRRLADEMEEPFAPALSGLVISATKAKLGRLPESGDWQALRDYCLDVLPVVISGRRVES